MTLNGITLKPINVQINDVEQVSSNTASDGTVYEYFRGSYTEITFDLQYIDADTRELLRAAQSQKCVLVLDTGEKYNVRPRYSAFTEVYTAQDVGYNVSVTCREVGGVS